MLATIKDISIHDLFTSAVATDIAEAGVISFF